MNWLVKKWRRHRFIKAYVILRNEAKRHKDAGHDIDFRAVNESFIIMECNNCPNLQP